MSIAMAPSCCKRTLRILTDVGRVSPRDLPSGKSTRPREQRCFLHFQGSAVYAVHAGAGTDRVDQEQRGFAFVLPLFDGLVRRHGASFDVGLSGYAPHPPSFGRKASVGTQIYDHIGCQAASKSH